MIKHYVNETGSKILLDCGVLVGTATAYYILYEKPGGVVGSFNADLYSTYSELAGATGTYFLSHTLVYGDLSIGGEWKLQAYVAAVDGTWWGETVKINILNQLE